jgi:hypothetical protein
VSVLQNLIANVGNINAPTYDGNSCVRVENTYRFLKGLDRMIISNYIFLEEAKFGNIMCTQKMPLLSDHSAKYYIPNSLPLGSSSDLDFRTPKVFPLGTSVYVQNIGNGSYECTVADVNNPCNRIIEIDENHNTGIAVGYLKDYGVGKNPNNFSKRYFELRGSTGKVYPHPVDSNAFSDDVYLMPAGRIYSMVFYQALIDMATAQGNRMFMYHFNYNDAEYVFVDYKGSMLDKVVVDDSLNGKTIEVIESVNATLKNMVGANTPYEESNIYNGGFYVDANYVSGETCYLVCKIK